MATETRAQFNRAVFEYGPLGLPHGVLICEERGTEIFVEHVIRFPGAPDDTLIPMLLAGVEEARSRGYASLSLYVPDEHPEVGPLALLTRRFGFEPYDTDAHGVYYRRKL